MSARATTLHASPWLGVFYVTGGGTGLLSETLNTPGASATVLEARVPYAANALEDLLGRAPEQSCSSITARQMAMAAFESAQALSEDPSTGAGHLFGIGCTASLATNRIKKGTHRAHWAIQTAVDTYSFSTTYDGDRDSEEQLLVDQLWQSLEQCLLNGPTVETAVFADTDIDFLHTHADAHLQPLLDSSPYRFGSDERLTQLLLPGSFNPLHDGHKQMLELAEASTGLVGAYELAVQNADKPNLDFQTIQERLSSIGDQPVWLTNTPNFEGKARLFPGATFALGIDTLVRIGELRFYQHRADLLDAALATFADLDTRFVVFGRLQNDQFMTLDDIDIPTELRARCIGVSERDYRNDISSTAMRNAAS